MKHFALVLSVLLFAFTPFASAQVVDDSDLQKQVREREESVNKLSTEEQLKLRNAERKAVEDPALKSALERRNKAIQEFRATLRACMIKADPTVESILAKVAIGVNKGP